MKQLSREVGMLLDQGNIVELLEDIKDILWFSEVIFYWSF